MVNVRLQHIADEAFISIGNMAYHYKNKEAIVHAILDELSRELRELMSEMNIVPLFEFMDHYFHQLYLLQRHYSFFYTDMLEVFRGYPEIEEKHQELIQWQQMQYRQMLIFNENRGVLELDKWPEQQERTIDQIWMSTHMYFSLRSIHKKERSVNDYCKQIWFVFVLLMTELGLLEFKQLRGMVVNTTNSRENGNRA